MTEPAGPRFRFPRASDGGKLGFVALGIVTVRPMTPADAVAFADASPDLPGSVDLASELSRTAVRAWVAEELYGIGLAYVVCSQVLDEIEILALATRAEARRRGLARALVARVVESSRQSGARRVSLEVGRSNLAARRLYETCGFSLFNVRRGYYQKTGDDALEMELVLCQT